ncbi:MAG: hypothetical protein ACK4K0_06010 [Flavobacteriales bacterium]
MQKNATPTTSLEKTDSGKNPNSETLSFLLNYSKSLEIKKSKKGYIEYLKN